VSGALSELQPSNATVRSPANRTPGVPGWASGPAATSNSALTGADGSRVRDSYRLITTLIDHRRFPAAAVVRLYHERWVRHEVAWSEWNSQKEDRLMLVT